MKRAALHCTLFVCSSLFSGVSALAQNPANSATFVRADATTQGNWPTTYGGDGYAMPQPIQSLPANVSSFAAESASYWAWATSTTDPRALKTPGGGPSQAVTWYNSSGFTIDVTVATGQIEQIALYAVDWDANGRAEVFNVVDGDSNAALNSQTLSTFTNGTYLIWTISGHVKINVNAQTGPNAVVSGVFFQSSSANTIRVPQDQPTIQAAINAAINGETVLVSPGTYYENINFIGKAITVKSSAGPATTIIDGGLNSAVAAFVTHEGRSSVLNGFTLQNGFTPFANEYMGGGIFSAGSSPTITNNRIINNTGCEGIGIGVDGGQPLIQGNLIDHNITTSCGPGYGGGIYLLATDSPQILNNTITNNVSGEGAGIWMNVAGTPTIRGNVISGNSGPYGGDQGGGIGMINGTSAEIVGNLIVNNSSFTGAGVYISVPAGADSILVNNTIANNSSSALVGAGIYLGGFDSGTVITNNVISAPAGQQAVTCSSVYSSVSPYFSYNDVYTGGQSPWVGTCDFTSNPGNRFADPSFVNLTASNFHLLPSSPVKDVGSNNAPDLPSTDLDGNNRIFNGTVDLGAYEYSGLTTYTLSASSVSFPDQPAGTTSQPFTTTLTNTGAVALELTAIASNSVDFPESDNCATSTGLLPGQSCQITVQFKPAQSGPDASNLITSANVSGYAISIPVSGNGIGGAPTSTAALVGTDTTTLGNWQSKYGADGYTVANVVQNLPPYASFSASQDLVWTWASSTTDPRVLHLPGGASGPASTWYAPTALSFDLNLTDGQSHQVTFYALDWDVRGRSETIQISDAVLNTVLSSTTISNFTNGIYAIFNISGHVHITVAFNSGPNPVISGIFFGGPVGAPPVPASLSITKTHVGHVTQGQQALVYTVTVSNAANAGPTSGQVAVTEAVPAGLSLFSMSGDGWSCNTNTSNCQRSDVLSPGSNYASIAVTVNVAANATSPQVNQVTVSGGGSASASASDSTIIEGISNPGTTAVFIGQDAKTQGAWQGVYGADGYSIEGSVQSAPVYAPSVTVQNNSTWTWAGTTSDTRAPQVPGTNAGTATSWYSQKSFYFDVNFVDGQTHYLALYAVDWDYQGRSETIQILDAVSNTQLDSRQIENFSGALYLVWKISGHVKIVVTSNAGPNAVISGVFFGAPAISYTFLGSNTAPSEDGLPVAFKYISRGLISSQTGLLSSQLLSCTNCFASSGVPAVVLQPSNAGYDTIDFADVNDEGTAFAFPLGSLGSLGTYISGSPFNPGTLTIALGN